MKKYLRQTETKEITTDVSINSIRQARYCIKLEKVAGKETPISSSWMNNETSVSLHNRTKKKNLEEREIEDGVSFIRTQSH